MPTPASHTNWPFLSIVAWPQGWERQAVAELLAGFGALDEATLNMRLARQPPMVLDRVDPSVAPAMIAALLTAGGDGFAFTLDDLVRLGPTMRIADLVVADGLLDVELHDGLRTSLRPATVEVLVRARLKMTTTTHRQVDLPSSATGRSRSWDSIKAEVESQSTKNIRTAEFLDLHTSDGSVYEIAGHRFGYRALGEMRGHGDKANMDSMSELLAHLCPDAVVDNYYELWRPPPGYQQLRLPVAGGTRDVPALAFYSRWAALTYRHVLGS